MLNIDSYIRGWRECTPTLSHGTLIEREIFTRIDPANPTKPGAVMQHVKRFSRAILEGGVAMSPSEHDSEQEILHVTNGRGKIEAEGQVERLSEGSAVLVPPNVSHVIVNESQEPLELLVLVEDFPTSRGEKAREGILVRDYHSLPVSVGGHWCHIVRKLFTAEDGLAALHSVLVVSIDGMNIGEPHSHGPGTDEVWYQLKGDSLLFLGRQIRRQRVGEAFMVPPDGETPHSSINYTDQPAQWFYFAHY